MKIIFIFITLISYVLAHKDKFSHYIIDEVPGGSYKYYSLTYDGFIRITLISETGDADLYASQTTTKPTYEPDQYCLQSATCGEDTILIPDSFRRPVSIGVYGHPSHEISKYILLVYETTDIEDISYERNSKRNTNEEQQSSISTSNTWYFLDLLFQLLF
ncbi:UPF0669 protein C6orf120 homolog [Osmia bicornis bicornis]|uniref:UPF0669 protein C6orf120 homolog n=1 Tax=Osmia bicornis bicornis TaxID=1437191 RepID=UPI001EAED466|nr:UPF0669 protein C6orf120 homolog [Osmia bicornis bicornis]XP_046141328.1 UPF0669 protein C6orf120 homolog [Osmia bicornis bicornis]